MVGQEVKDVFDVRAEVADGVSSAFPEGQTVVGLVVEGVSSSDSVESVMVAAVVVAVAVEGMSSLGSGGFGSGRGADVLEVVREAADIYVIVVTEVAVNGADWEES